MRYLLTLLFAALSFNAVGQVSLNDGLVGWWPFNGNLFDASGNENHGQNNGASFSTDRFGNDNSAGLFNGTSSYVSGALGGLNSLSESSVSIWILSEGDAGGQPYDLFFQLGNYGQHTFAYAYNHSGQNVDLYSHCFNNPYSTLNINNEWHNLVIVDGSNSTRLYVDGELFNIWASGNGEECYNGSNAFLIGGGADNQYTTGLIDEVGFWDRVLDAEEVVALYNNGGSWNPTVFGCTDATACNYQSAASVDDGSCSVEDVCGICDGGGIPDAECDCFGNTFDALGVCGGSCVEDADGDLLCDSFDSCIDLVCGGADSDCDGICDSQETEGCLDENACNYNMFASFEDGSCLSLDECGICGGDNSFCADCAGVPNGDAILDDCGTCVSDNTNGCGCLTTISFESTLSGGQITSQNFELTGVLAQITFNLYFTATIDEYPSDMIVTITGANGNCMAGEGEDIIPSVNCYDINFPEYWTNSYSGFYSYTMNALSSNIGGPGTWLFDLQNGWSGWVGSDVGSLATYDLDIELIGVCSLSDCTNPLACNYNPNATIDDGSCFELDVCGVCGGSNDLCSGCTDDYSCNYDSEALFDDGSCWEPDLCGICGGDNSTCIGCTDEYACNYDIGALIDEGNCIYVDTDGDGICDEFEIEGCMTSTACNYNPLATDASDSCEYFEYFDAIGVCNGDCLADLNNNGVCDIDDVYGCVISWSCNYTEGVTVLIPCVYPDECGICGGSGIAEGECDCAGNVLDECGVCGGSGFADGTCDCAGSLIDECGVCGGNSSSCDGFTGLTVELDTMFLEEGSDLEFFGTYRVYANFTNQNDAISAIYSDVVGLGTPSMFIDAPCGCHNPVSGSAIMDATNTSAFWSTFPDWEFDTYWTIGMTNGDAVGLLPQFIGMPGGDEICSTSTNDGTVYVLGIPPNSLAGEELRVLIAQVTTCGDWSLQTCIQTFVNADQTNLVQTCPDLLEVVHPYLDGECVNDSDGDGVCDEFEIAGCSEPEACNYDENATNDDGSCTGIPDGACDCAGNELDECGVCGGDGIADGNCDCDGNVLDECGVCGGDGISDGTCDCAGNVLDALGVCGGDCTDDDNGNGVCDELEVYGCTYPDALNYNSETTADDGSCIYEEFDLDAVYDSGYTDGFEDGENSVICPETSSCPSDLNGDGSVGMSDLLIFLSSFGDVCEVDEDLGFLDCGDDINHDGYDYSTVLIGDQCWFSENCRYLPDVSPPSEGSETEPYYYIIDYQGNDVEEAKITSNYETFGVLYNWPAVMTDEICPSGWHIPSDGEFTQLTDFLGGESVAGGKMKEAGYDHWNSPNTGATNSSGWTGLPGGYRDSAGLFGVNGVYGYWWSASEAWPSSVERNLYYDLGNIFAESVLDRNYGMSARCVRD